MSDEIKVQFKAVIGFTVECQDEDEVALAKAHLPHDFTRLVRELHGDGHLGGDHEYCVTKAVLTSFDEDVRRGFRLFVCPDCREVTILATRDHTSPSQETCPYCSGDMQPTKSWSDARLPADKMNNLALPAGVRTLGEFERHLDPPVGSWALVGKNDTDHMEAASYTGAMQEALLPHVMIYHQDGPLEHLCKETQTTPKNWVEIDGEDSGHGVDHYYRNTSTGDVWYVNDDQGEYGAEQMSGGGDE